MKGKILCLFAIATLLFGCSKETTEVDNQKVLKATATINASSVQQTIKGYGGANILAWTGDLTEDQRIKAFSPWSGIGLSIVRVRVPLVSSEFSREKATIDKCKYYGGSAIATAWSAPASMKTNNSAVGGQIKTSSYADYAAHLKAFNTAVGGLAAISPANEPDYKVSYESMELTATQVADFVVAQGSNCGAPIMAPESFNMDPTYISNYLSNATAKSKTSYVCGHIYGRDPYYLGNIGKPVWMTEHYVNSKVSGNDWTTAITVAKEIHDCMNAGWSAYVWWYIRRSYGPMDENGYITKTGYVMANFAKYVRPGYSKISCSSNPTSGVYVTAYKSDTKLVVVAINQNSSSTYQPFSISGLTVSNGFQKFVTSSSKNCQYMNDVPVTNNTWGISMDASSVTTLVSK